MRGDHVRVVEEVQLKPGISHVTLIASTTAVGQGTKPTGKFPAWNTEGGQDKWTLTAVSGGHFTITKDPTNIKE